MQKLLHIFKDWQLRADCTALTKKRRGFTLIEVVISLTVFLIFVGIIMRSFIYLLGVQIEANRYRKVYAEVEQVVRLLRTDARNMAVDYNQSADQQGTIQELRFVSGDQLAAATYTVTFPSTEDDEITVRRSEQARSNLNASFELVSETDLSFKDGVLTDITLAAVPDQDPFTQIVSATTPLQQPRIHVAMSVVPRAYPNRAPFFYANNSFITLL